MDIDTDTELGTEGGFESVTFLKSLHKNEPHFTDFSNLLGISMREGSNSSFTIVNTELYSPLQNPADIYGWDADFESKTTYGLSAERICGCKCQQVKVTGSKRKLLQRVFSKQPTRK